MRQHIGPLTVNTLGTNKHDYIYMAAASLRLDDGATLVHMTTPRIVMTMRHVSLAATGCKYPKWDAHSKLDLAFSGRWLPYDIITLLSLSGRWWLNGLNRRWTRSDRWPRYGLTDHYHCQVDDHPMALTYQYHSQVDGFSMTLTNCEHSPVNGWH